MATEVEHCSRCWAELPPGTVIQLTVTGEQLCPHCAQGCCNVQPAPAGAYGERRS